MAPQLRRAKGAVHITARVTNEGRKEFVLGTFCSERMRIPYRSRQDDRLSVIMLSLDRFLNLFISFDSSLLQGRLPVDFEQSAQEYLIFFLSGHIHMTDISLGTQQEDDWGRINTVRPK
ncbi:hypothetical protein TNCV_2460691 [Trichonephila clavipes]|nr:hypothetical protein TNCV_2460691 [Trichonephila clavipes]